MKNHLSYSEFEMAIQELDFRSIDCMGQIGELRRLLEEAQTARSLTLHQWRVLWEDVSVIQARCALIQHDGWRYMSPITTGLIFSDSSSALPTTT